MSRANVKDKRKAQLIAAALESIAKRGLLETTITHISKGAGMSRGIINFYFTSKETMLRETLKTLIDEYEVEWGEALAKSSDEGRARIDALIAVHFGKKLCSARRLNVMSAFWGHAASQSAYRNQLEAADAKIENALTAALAHTLGGSLEEARDAATQLHALIRGLWLNFMLNPKDSAREVLAAQAASFIDRLTGAPVRIVRDHIIARPAKPEVASVMPSCGAI
jgi:TetR/AcrR family transcriptional regulator, transcriptional repressor of bet genes